MLQQFWIAYLTITRKEIKRFTRIWVQTIVPPVIMVALYFVIFGNLIGQRIGEMDGMLYIDFIMPGLVMMSIITNSYANVVSSFYGAKYSRHIEEMQVAPVPNLVILAGFVTGGVARGLSVGVAVTLVSLLFTDFSMHSPMLVLVVALLTSSLFAMAGLINAIFANSFFYSIRLLPEFWQQVSLGNPILYMVNSFRLGFRGASDIELSTALLVILSFNIVLFAISLFLLERGIGTRQ
jgi:ABC-2 type transport system permease protein